jgi:hypothetical protein
MGADKQASTTVSGDAVNWYSNHFEPIQTFSKPFNLQPIHEGPSRAQKILNKMLL